ncbi:MAG: choice-of-anchor I family protein, partial [Coprobacillus sp.]
DDFKVDFVLGGHDHVYSRSYVLKDGKRNSEKLDNIHDAKGTIYITGNCCSDMQYYTPFEKLDKSNNADYPVLANGKTGSAAYLEGDSLPIGNQEWNQEYSPSYALFNVVDNQISVKVYNLDGDSTTPTSKEIDSFTVSKNTNGGEKTTGFENASSLLTVEQSARYNSGITNADGGVTEIIDYNHDTGWAYVVNGKTGYLTAIAIKDIEKKNKIDLLDGYDIDIKSMVNVSSFVYGDMTSVAVSRDGKTLAVAIQAEATNDNGRVALLNCNKDGTLTLKKIVEVGVQPDMVVFTKDDKQILTANEGEPRDGYNGAVDPKGSISVINTTTQEVKNLDFTKFDSQRDELVDKGIVLKKNTLPSTDFEPEYIAVSDTKAYITLQEANAIAILDLETLTIENINSVGFEDYSKTSIDIDKKDEKYNPKTYSSLRGIRMPDAISVYTVNNVDYLITANEGDSRDWNGYLNEIEVNFGKGKSSPSGQITSDNSGLTGKVIFFDTNDYDGLNKDNDYLFGGRSSTMFKVENQSLQEVFTTGNDFESKTANYLKEYFNCSNDNNTIDDRSGKKGPEAEGVTIGQIEDKTFAFIGLERIGGVMVYEITNPEQPTFVNYINSRDFSKDILGDDSPEGMRFVSASESPTGQPQLYVAYEVSGTVGIYDLTLNKTDKEESNKPNGDNGDTDIDTSVDPDDNNGNNTNKGNQNDVAVKTNDNDLVIIMSLVCLTSLVAIIAFINKDKLTS